MKHFPNKTITFLFTVMLWMISVSVAISASNTQVQRGELAAMYSELARMAQQSPDAFPPKFSERANQAISAVSELSDSDMEKLGNMLNAVPDWNRLPELMSNALSQQDKITALAAPPNCPSSPNAVAWIAARSVAQGLAFAVLFAPDDLVVVSVAAGFGGGGTISAHPIKLALQVAYEAANSVVLGFESADILSEDCQNEAHRELLRTVDDKLTQHDFDIKARLAVIEQKLGRMDAKLDELLRLMITPQGKRDGFPLKP